MRPTSQLLDRLKRDRLRLHMAQPNAGFGERRSSQKGVGLEFAESRPFRDGDDFKNLDPRLSVRTGEPHIREFFFERRASVQIIVDVSASMLWPDGSKLELARLAANLMGFIALISGDAVQVVSANGAHPRLSPWFQGERRSQELFEHVEQIMPDREIPFSVLLETALRTLKRKALVVVVSDFLEESLTEWLPAIGRGDRDVMLLDLTHKDERSPSLRPGDYSLLEAEGEAMLALSLDASLNALYRQEFAAWKEEVRTLVVHRGGIHMPLSAPFGGDMDSLAHLLREQLMRTGR